MTGRYPTSLLRSVPRDRLDRYFEPDGDGHRVRDAIRRRVVFKRHDLLRDAYPGDQDLIVCRNVVIYFTEAAKAEVFRRFAAALAPGGALWLGATEAILGSRELGLEPIAPWLYRKTAVGTEVVSRAAGARQAVEGGS